MILFIILILMVLMLSIVALLAISAGGAIFILIFGDVIVCIMFIIWIIKKIFFKK